MAGVTSTTLKCFVLRASRQRLHTAFPARPHLPLQNRQNRRLFGGRATNANAPGPEAVTDSGFPENEYGHGRNASGQGNMALDGF